LEVAVAIGFAAGDEGAGVGVPVGLGERDAVEGGVELAVAGAAEAVSGPVGGPDREWGGAVVAGVGVVGSESVDAGGLAEDLGGGEGPAAADLQERRSEVFDEVGDLSLELVDVDGELAASLDEVACQACDEPVDSLGGRRPCRRCWPGRGTGRSVPSRGRARGDASAAVR